MLNTSMFCSSAATVSETASSRGTRAGEDRMASTSTMSLGGMAVERQENFDLEQILG